MLPGIDCSNKAGATSTVPQWACTHTTARGNAKSTVFTTKLNVASPMPFSPRWRLSCCNEYMRCLLSAYGHWGFERASRTTLLDKKGCTASYQGSNAQRQYTAHLSLYPNTQTKLVNCFAVCTVFWLQLNTHSCGSAEKPKVRDQGIADICFANTACPSGKLSID